jgi:hypothetical protein
VAPPVAAVNRASVHFNDPTIGAAIDADPITRRIRRLKFNMLPENTSLTVFCSVEGRFITRKWSPDR